MAGPPVRPHPPRPAHLHRARPPGRGKVGLPLLLSLLHHLGARAAFWMGHIKGFLGDDGGFADRVATITISRREDLLAVRDPQTGHFTPFKARENWIYEFYPTSQPD